MALDILIVDDEEDIRDLVSGVLEDEGYETRTAANSDAALGAIDARRPSLVLLDVWLQSSRMDGLELLEEIKKRDPSLPRSEEHTSELQSLMRISYAVFCLKQKTQQPTHTHKRPAVTSTTHEHSHPTP